MKKRGLAGLLALALILALGACGGTEAQEDAAQDQKMEEAAPPQEEETSETDGEDGVPVTIEGPETADDSQQLQEDEPDLGSRPADPAKEPETGAVRQTRRRSRYTSRWRTQSPSSRTRSRRRRPSPPLPLQWSLLPAWIWRISALP